MNRELWNQRARTYADSVSISEVDIHFSPWLPGDSSLQLVGAVEGQEVLELGCGVGENLCCLVRRGATVVGIDYAAAQIELASEKLAAHQFGRVKLMEVDYSQPLPPELLGRFDCVLSSLSFNFSRPIEAVLTNASRALRPAGRLVFSVFHPAWLSHYVGGSEALSHGSTCSDWWGGGYELAALQIEPTVANLRGSGFGWLEIYQPLVVACEAYEAPYRFLPMADFEDEIALAGKIPSCAILRAFKRD